jgi:hypothetical protein
MAFDPQRDSFSVEPADGLERRNRLHQYTHEILNFLSSRRNSFFARSSALSTNYATHWHAIAREFARFRMAMEDYYQDQLIGTADTETNNIDPGVRRDFIFQKIGTYIKLDDPLFPAGDRRGEVSDQTYRTFVYTLLKLFFEGATKAAVEEGSSFYSSLPISVTELVWEPDSDISDQFGFTLDIDLDAASDMNIANLHRDLQDILAIITPAHVLPLIRFVISDNFGMNLGCNPVYDFFPNEVIPTTIQVKSLGAREITDITENRITLDDDTVLFVLESTAITDVLDEELDFSELQVGDTLDYEGSPSPGRFQYYRPLSELPAAFGHTYMGFFQEPLITDVDPTVIARTDFQFYVKKVFQGIFEAQTPLSDTALCEKLHVDIWEWEYEDFRHCADERETEVVTAETPTWETPTSLMVRFGPIVKPGSFEPADDPSDVIVRVNGTPVVVTDVEPFTGRIWLQDPTVVTDVIEVDYSWYENPTFGLMTNTDGTGTNWYGQGDARFPHSAWTNEGVFGCDPSYDSCGYEAWFRPECSLTNDPETFLTNTEGSPRHVTNDGRVISSAVFDKYHDKEDWRTSRITLRQGTPLLMLRYGENPDVRVVFVDGSLLNDGSVALNDLFTLNDAIPALATGSDVMRYVGAEFDCEHHVGRSRLTFIKREDVDLESTWSDDVFALEEPHVLYSNDFDVLDNTYVLGDTVNLGDPNLPLYLDPDQVIPNVLGGGRAVAIRSASNGEITWDLALTQMMLAARIAHDDVVTAMAAEDMTQLGITLPETMNPLQDATQIPVAITYYYSSLLNEGGNLLNQGFMLNASGYERIVRDTASAVI